MKKLLISLLTVVLVSGALISGTKAWFTDTETSTGNTFSTGTIDIAVNGENSWTETFTLEDMKPSQVEYIDLLVYNNETSNPVNLYKSLENMTGSDYLTSEPECEEEGGTWDNGVCGDSHSPVYNLEDWINYDMVVELYRTDPTGNPNAKPVWHETLYLDEQNVKLGNLPESMYLGMVPSGWYMKVMQSYHLVSDAGNEYQGDTLTFDIVLQAEQLGASALRLENKQEVNGVSITMYDSTYADLSYGVKDREFSYVLDVYDFQDGEYTLVAWKDDSYQWNWGNFAGTTVLGNVTVSGGVAHVESSVELGRDLENVKVWLVPGNLGTPGTLGVSLPWSPANTLFETGLMTYYDADL